MAIPSPLQPVMVGATEAHMTRNTFSTNPRLAEVSTGATTGTRYALVRNDPQWQIDLPLDDAAFPEVIGWVSGATVTIKFKTTGTKCDIITNTTVGNVTKTVDTNGDAIRVVVTGQGGDLTYNQNY